MASEGPNSPGIGEDGGATTAFVSPENIYTSNDARAVASDINDEGALLIARGFGMSIPSDATLNGFVVTVEGSVSDAATQSILLDANGGVSYTSAKDPALTASESIATLGAADDLWDWGESPLPTPDQVNASDFRVLLVFTAEAPSTISIDHVTLTVHYTESGGSGPANLKSICGVAKASVKKICGVDLANVKAVAGVV